MYVSTELQECPDFPCSLRGGVSSAFFVTSAIVPLKSHRGSVRQFFSPTRGPNLVSFHEPHSGDALHESTLYDSLRKLQLSSDKFVQLLGRR